jgi:hypothetical protein
MANKGTVRASFADALRTSWPPAITRDSRSDHAIVISLKIGDTLSLSRLCARAYAGADAREDRADPFPQRDATAHATHSEAGHHPLGRAIVPRGWNRVHPIARRRAEPLKIGDTLPRLQPARTRAGLTVPTLAKIAPTRSPQRDATTHANLS